MNPISAALFLTQIFAVMVHLQEWLFVYGYIDQLEHWISLVDLFMQKMLDNVWKCTRMHFREVCHRWVCGWFAEIGLHCKKYFYTCTYMYMNIYMHIYIYARTHTHTHSHTHTWTQTIQTHTDTHLHTHAAPTHKRGPARILSLIRLCSTHAHTSARAPHTAVTTEHTRHIDMYRYVYI